jgi:hypothetical protein
MHSLNQATNPTFQKGTHKKVPKKVEKEKKQESKIEKLLG